MKKQEKYNEFRKFVLDNINITFKSNDDKTISLTLSKNLVYITIIRDYNKKDFSDSQEKWAENGKLYNIMVFRYSTFKFFKAVIFDIYFNEKNLSILELIENTESNYEK